MGLETAYLGEIRDLLRDQNEHLFPGIGADFASIRDLLRAAGDGESYLRSAPVEAIRTASNAVIKSLERIGCEQKVVHGSLLSKPYVKDENSFLPAAGMTG